MPLRVPGHPLGLADRVARDGKRKDLLGDLQLRRRSLELLLLPLACLRLGIASAALPLQDHARRHHTQGRYRNDR